MNLPDPSAIEKKEKGDVSKRCFSTSPLRGLCRIRTSDLMRVKHAL